MKFRYVWNGKPISEASVKKLRYEDFVDVCVHVTWIHESLFRCNGESLDKAG